MQTNAEISEVENKRGRGRPKGTARTGGRAKGTPNKNSSKLLENLNNAGINLAEKFIELIEALPPEKQLSEIKWLFQFCFPLLKAIEPLAENKDTPPQIHISNDELEKLI